MKFELLPIEIFIECFQYLNAPDIFYSFDRLNNRFHTLIRNIQLHLDFFHVTKSLFNEFCQTIRLNPEIKRNIIYLQISNKDTHGETRSFLSLFPLNEFIHLRSLSFIYMDRDNIGQVVLPMLALLPDLYKLYAPHWITEAEEIASVISKSKIRVLKLYAYHPTSIHRTSSVTSLRLMFCSVSELLSILNYTSILKYVKIDRLSDRNTQYDDNVDYKSEFSKISAVHLNQLHLNHSSTSFGSLELLLKCIPNLKIFSIVAENADLTDANRWQHLIESSLPQLRVFNFRFDYRVSDSAEMLIKLSPFQTEFWHQHHWYTNYVVDGRLVSVYTIPYPCSYYKLTSTMQKYNSSSANDLNEFDNVKYLSLCVSAIRDDSPWYFPNVQSLCLTGTWICHNENDECQLEIEQIDYLKKMVNLSNNTELEINKRCVITSELLFELLNQMPNVSSLKLKTQIISSFYSNHELCELLSKKIKILDFTYPSWNHYIKIQDLDWFCRPFSNVQELQCDIDNVDDVLLILTKCSKLSIILIKCVIKRIYTWFQSNALTSNVYIDYEQKYFESDDNTPYNSS